MPSSSDPPPQPDPPRPRGPDDHAFVIKLYARGDHRLYGHITHAMSRRRGLVHHPEDVLAFLAPYLAAMDVRLRPRSRLIVWLSRLAAARAARPSAPEASSARSPDRLVSP